MHEKKPAINGYNTGSCIAELSLKIVGVKVFNLK